MNKDKIEEIKKKFEKLSPTDKIRYNLGHLKQMVNVGWFSSYILGVFIITMFFLLPTIYSIFTRWQLFLTAFFLIVFLVIISLVFVFKVLMKSQKELDKFLNEKSKKK